MPSGYIQIGHVQVQQLKPGDVIRFMDPDHKDPSKFGGWLVAIAIDPKKDNPNIIHLKVHNGYKVLDCERRRWAAVECLANQGMTPLNEKPAEVPEEHPA